MSDARSEAPCWELLERERARADALLNAVIPIGAALTVEKDLGRLLERILVEAQKFCGADSGSLYLLGDDGLLRFAIVRNDSLGLAMGGTSGVAITFPPVPLYDPETGAANSRYIVAHAAVTGASVNIADAYEAEGFDFSGTRAFDSRTGYRSTSLLTVPLLSGSGKVIGVLQLINALDWRTKEIAPFDANMQQIIEALGRLAAVALEGYLREQRLTEQLDQLRIEIDEAKKARHVAEITETDYFRELRDRSKRLRQRHQGE
jgi:GAF domain-containing protein